MSNLTTPEPINTGPSRASFHRLATFRTCEQLYGYTNLLHIEPQVISPALALGTLIHIGLAWWAVRKMDRPALDPIEAMREAPRRVVHQFERAREAVEAYMEQWKGHDPMTPIDVERELAATLGGRLYTQKADRVVSMGGAVFLVDVKSTQGAVEQLPLIYRMSPQLVGYSVLGPTLVPQIYGKPFGGVIVDLVGTSPPFRSKRHHVDIPPGLQGPFLRDAAATLEAMEKVGAAADPWHFPRSGFISGACTNLRWGPCDYIELCRRGQAALDERFIIARDEVSATREGSGT